MDNCLIILQKIIGRLDDMEKKIDRLLDKMPKCSCPTPDQRRKIFEDIISRNEYGASGMCDLHGRWEVLHPNCG